MFIAKKQAVLFGSFKTYPCEKVCSASFDRAQRRSVSRPSSKQLQLRNVCPFLSYEFMRNYNGDYPKIRCVGITLCMLVVYDVHQPTTYFQSRSTNAQHEPTMAPCGRQFTRHHVCGEAAACRPWRASRAHFWSRWLFQFKLPKVEGWCWIIALDTCTQLPGPLPITDVGIFGVTWWFLMLQLRRHVLCLALGSGMGCHTKNLRVPSGYLT